MKALQSPAFRGALFRFRPLSAGGWQPEWQQALTAGSARSVRGQPPALRWLVVLADVLACAAQVLEHVVALPQQCAASAMSALRDSTISAPERRRACEPLRWREGLRTASLERGTQ